MKGHLPKLIQPRPPETALSVLCRLADVNHISPGELAALSGIAWHDLRCGASGAIERLAEVSGASFDRLRQATPRLAEPRTYDWRGCRFHDSHIRARVLHACPACIREDLDTAEGSPWMRQDWVLRAYRRCHIHGCQVIEVTDWQDIRRSGIMDYLCQAAASGAGSEEVVPDRSQKTVFESYIRQRLDGTLTVANWIDGLPLQVVIEGSEMIGAFLSHPAYRKEALETEDWQQCTQEGFAALSRGPDHLTQRLETHISATAVPNALGYTKLFGSTYPWLLSRSGDPDFATIIDIIRQLAHRVLRADYPVPFLGGQIPPVDGCTVIGLATRYEVPNRTVRRILTLSGVEPQGSTDTVWGQVSLYADAPAKTAILRYLDEVDGRQARHLLSATQAAFDSLIALGVVVAVPKPIIRGPRYSAKAMKKLRRDLVRSAHGDVLRPGDVPIAEAARRVPCQIGVMVKLVLSGRLSAAVVPRTPLGLADLHVDIDEVRDLLSDETSGTKVRAVSIRKRKRRPSSCHRWLMCRPSRRPISRSGGTGHGSPGAVGTGNGQRAHCRAKCPHNQNRAPTSDFLCHKTLRSL